MTPTAAVRSILGDYVSEARCREVVVAVLRACREPSEGMVETGANKIEADVIWEIQAFDSAKKAYTAMIDALIEEVQCSAG